MEDRNLDFTQVMAVLKGCYRQNIFQFKWKRHVFIRPYPRAGVLKLFCFVDPFEGLVKPSDLFFEKDVFKCMTRDSEFYTY